MTWHMTVSGRSIDLSCIGVQQLQVTDVAYSLSLVNRYVGHTTRPVSEAEHSLYVVDVLQREYGVYDPAALTAGLLNSAYKALAGDISAGMKELLGPAWTTTKAQVHQAVLRRLGFWTAYTTHREHIEAADQHVKSAEREQLMFQDGDVWPCQVTHPAPLWLRMDSAERTAEDWRCAYLTRFRHLEAALIAAQAAIPIHQPRSDAAA